MTHPTFASAPAAPVAGAVTTQDEAERILRAAYIVGVALAVGRAAAQAR